MKKFSKEKILFKTRYYLRKDYLKGWRNVSRWWRSYLNEYCEKYKIKLNWMISIVD